MKQENIVWAHETFKKTFFITSKEKKKKGASSFFGYGFPAVLFARGFKSQPLDRDQTVHI
jgi:hypothetical protein